MLNRRNRYDHLLINCFSKDSIYINDFTITYCNARQVSQKIWLPIGIIVSAINVVIIMNIRHGTLNRCRNVKCTWINLTCMYYCKRRIHRFFPTTALSCRLLRIVGDLSTRHDLFSFLDLAWRAIIRSNMLIFKAVIFCRSPLVETRCIY